MKKCIGNKIATIGARLWQNGGFAENGRYEDLSVAGKIGYRMFCVGLEMMGFSPDDFDEAVT
jgi:hypothetical protein